MPFEAVGIVDRIIDGTAYLSMVTSDGTALEAEILPSEFVENVVREHQRFRLRDVDGTLTFEPIPRIEVTREHQDEIKRHLDAGD